ncbi:Holliday junction branch migration protein RuvA [Enterococcus asini]|uniref:Holliday junction branch migration protein RuvA n=1 Tax=Enterococcus asini TaxID=57732 RepID=UPI002890D9B0|nr:Holliday junction branch migration protein RuvA [Enterococcus asini]MDT2757216.1 Holliday junction branch migration protein RuvA [Enterococcus asini]
MFEYIYGVVTDITPAYIVLENQGIGYLIAMGNPYRYSGKKEKVKVYVHQVIREDAHLLYGFEKRQDKELFLKLISVSGIGPKSGLAIMANEDHSGMVAAIEAGNINYLVKFPGVGKKTAQQMVLDLQGKLGAFVEGDLFAPEEEVPSGDATALTEALAALEALGYSTKEIKRVEKALKALEEQSTDEYLRAGLKLLMK